MQEQQKVIMREKVTVAKFDKTLEDDPKTPYEVTVQESATEVTLAEAMAMGFVPKSEQIDGTGQVIVQGDMDAAKDAL